MMFTKPVIYLCLTIIIVSSINAVETTKEITFETNYGEIVFEIYPHIAPKLAARFIEFCEKGYYKGTYFHFVDANFIIAGGDLNTRKEKLSPDIIAQYGTLDDEISAKALGLDRLLVRNSYLGNHLERDNPVRRLSMKQFLEEQGYGFNDGLSSIPTEYGTLAFAGNRPNSNYTQFFIVTSKKGTPWLDGKNTVIGKVVKGMDTVHQIANLPYDANNNPLSEYRAEIIDIIVP